jgi:hypothetical protein
MKNRPTKMKGCISIAKSQKRLFFHNGKAFFQNGIPLVNGFVTIEILVSLKSS